MFGQNGWRFEGRSFPTISELVNHQHLSGEPVTTKSQTILKNAILREQWQLRNDDIALEQKIGNVSPILNVWLIVTLILFWEVIIYLCL